jgi:exopolyphosphatase/guanosine-5'-triphosphate,3'-diphosphate pyrophosphatase
MRVERLWVLATAACRDARNGREFIAAAEQICRTKIDVISGQREAELTAFGVVSGFHRPDGIVGDLGGGSLELVDVQGARSRPGTTLPLGGLALQDRAGKSIKKAEKLVKSALDDVKLLKAGEDRNFYAVGGTWRALARLHIFETGYPLRVMHGYSIPAKEALTFLRRVRRLAQRGDAAELEAVAGARRPLLAYAALVLQHIIRIAKPKRIVISVYGVREGLLYDMLPARERRKDGLMAAARQLNELRSRSPRHGDELLAWSDTFMRVTRQTETAEERRLRHAGCLLADIGWRAHPDYRGEQSLNLIANGNFGEISHVGRAFLALTVFYRYSGLSDDALSPLFHELLPQHLIDRARVLGTLFRIGHLISAGQAGVLRKVHFRNRKRKLILRFERGRAANLSGDRVTNRWKQLCRLIGRSGLAEVK